MAIVIVMNSYKFDGIQTGLKESFTGSFTHEDVLTFARLSDNHNPLHLNPDFASKKGFSGCPLYGMLAAAKFSGLLGMLIPGEHALCLTQSIFFHHPIYEDQLFTVVGTVISKSVATQTIEVKTEIILENICAVYGG